MSECEDEGLGSKKGFIYKIPFVLYNTWLMIASMLINRWCKWQIFIIDLNTGFGPSQVEA
jgi:hypothetical protein